MKVLILGGGQLARSLLNCAPEGWTVNAVARDRCDLAQEHQLHQTVTRSDADLIINAAAYTAVDKAESESEVAHAVNGVAPGVIARAAAEAGKRMVHVSTDFVFDGRSSLPYKPGDHTNPLSVYGASKLAGEQSVTQADGTALIVRTAWVYASHGRNFAETMLRLMRERDELRVVADQIGTPTWSATLARGIYGLAAAKASGLHHLTDAGVASWYDFAVAISEEAQAAGVLSRAVRIIPITSEEYPTSAHRPAYSVLDKTVTWAILGEAGPHWRASLRNMIKELPNG